MPVFVSKLLRIFTRCFSGLQNISRDCWSTFNPVWVLKCRLFVVWLLQPNDVRYWLKELYFYM